MTTHARTINPTEWLPLLPQPGREDNKYSRGFGFMLAGEWMTGASILASLAAQRIGAGLIVMATPGHSAADIYRIRNVQAIVTHIRDTMELKELIEDSRIRALLVGPGLGDSSAVPERVFNMVRSGRPTVIDADGLNIVARDRDFFEETLEQYHVQDRRHQVILTPHDGEFARLFPEYADTDRVAGTQAASRLLGVTIIRKGADTIIVDGQTPETPLLHSTGSPWLASAGTGDVLAGLCFGLLTQGLPPKTVAVLACLIHAECAQHAGAGLIAEDLVEAIPKVLQHQFNTFEGRKTVRS